MSAGHCTQANKRRNVIPSSVALSARLLWRRSTSGLSP
ncbi:hypothetical protein BF49_3204 [Bradyrhizobium sp.]|nr:hypothetical protein BF49_3204 [Bradyrhizobium sp.]